MPDTDKRKIKHVSFGSPTQQQARRLDVVSDTKAGAQVNAATYTSDHGPTGIDVLAKTLAGINPSLSEFTERFQKESDTLERGRAAKDFADGAEYAPASRAYEMEYMKQKAIADGIKLDAELMEHAQNNWQMDPGEYNAQKLAITKKYLGSAENPYYAQIFADRAQAAEARANEKYRTLVHADQVSQWKGNVGTEVIATLKYYDAQIAGTEDPEAKAALREERDRVMRATADAKIEAGKALGLRALDVTTAILDATVKHMTETGDDSASNWAHIKGKDGVAAADNGELAKKVEEAEVRSLEVRRLKMTVAEQERHMAQGRAVREVNEGLMKYEETGDVMALDAAKQAYRKNRAIMDPEQAQIWGQYLDGIENGTMAVKSDPVSVNKGWTLVARGAITADWLEANKHLLSMQDYASLAREVERQREARMNPLVRESLMDAYKIDNDLIGTLDKGSGRLKEEAGYQAAAEYHKMMGNWRQDWGTKHPMTPVNLIEYRRAAFNTMNELRVRYGGTPLEAPKGHGQGLNLSDTPIQQQGTATKTATPVTRNRARLNGIASDK